MKTRFVIRRAARSLRHAKVRTLLTSLAIAVGSFTLTLSLAAGEGSRQYADKLISSNINPQAVFVVGDKALVGEGGVAGGGLKEYSDSTTQYGGLDIKTLTPKNMDTLKNDKDIASVLPTYLVEAQYLTVEGYGKKYTADVSVYDASVRAEAAAGSLPSLGTQIKDDEIVVPEAFLATLGGKTPESYIGKKVTLHLVKQTQPTQEQINQAFITGGQDSVKKLIEGEARDVVFTIGAVSKNSATSLSASSALFVSENQARDLSDFLTKDTPQYRNYVAATAIVKNGADPERVKERLQNVGMTARTAKDMQSLLFTIVNLLQSIVIGFGILALIASVFGIINTQYISVLERTQQIGLMKALGMRRRDVARLFRYEAAWIGLLGGLIGSAAAWGVGSVLNPLITEQLNLGAGVYLLIFEPAPIAILVLALMIVAIIAGYLPARKAAKLDPIEALRTE